MREIRRAHEVNVVMAEAKTVIILGGYCQISALVDFGVEVLLE